MPPGAPKPGSTRASANAPYPHLTAGSTLFESGSIQLALQRLSLPSNFSLDQMGISKAGLVISSIVHAFAGVEELSQVHELGFIFNKSKPTTSDTLQREIGTRSVGLIKR